jgi:AraC-like DNA-binding protein
MDAMTLDPVSDAGGQSFRERLPAGVLTSHLATVWVQSVADGAAPYVHRTVPNGSVEVAVEVGSQPIVIGPHSSAIVGTLAPGATVVGLRFRHGAAPGLLGVPASELVDQSVEWDALPRSPGKGLGEAIAAAHSSDSAAALLERAVLELLPEAGSPDPLVTAAANGLLPGSAADVGSLQTALFVSERHFRRRMVAAVGFPPKVLQRVLRFQTFLALARHGGDLATLAANAGYADQAHLSHESIRLAGATPSTLLREAREHCVGVHDHTPSWLPLLRARARAQVARG